MTKNGHDDPVILLDRRGRPAGTAPKAWVHGVDTPLHLGFSCYVFDHAGRVLVTRRASSKATWPDVWSNACCGHPRPGESLRAAVTRRLSDELGLRADRMTLAVSDFTYRAVMDNGVVEHELCPVVVAEVEGQPTLNPAEVGDAAWVAWPALCARARTEPSTLSPWAVEQIAELVTLDGGSPPRWIGRLPASGLDRPYVVAGPPPAGQPSLDALAAICGPVATVLDQFVATRTSELAVLDPALLAVADEVAALLAAGGKRLRPAFVYWGHRASGAPHDAGVAAVAAAVEMLHTFALLHDDVMDRAATRRGRPAASLAFAGLHRRERLDGDADWFGTSAAILAGDLAFLWADQLLDAAPVRPSALARARRHFTTLRAEVMAGQYLDLRLDHERAGGVERARRVALLKSGRYTVTRPLAIGWSLATEGDVPDAITAYGDAIGLAFQMRDDVLGLFGDPTCTGKPATDDLREGKRTVLVERALALATPAQRAVLSDGLGDPLLDDEGAARCRDVVAATGALASVEAFVRDRHAAALDAVRDVPEPARGALRSLAALAVERDR